MNAYAVITVGVHAIARKAINPSFMIVFDGIVSAAYLPIVRMSPFSKEHRGCALTLISELLQKFN